MRSKLALFLIGAALGTALRTPTWGDYFDVENLVKAAIENSTCPVGNLWWQDAAHLQAHWDYDPSTPATQDDGDCVEFPKIRNPFPLGSRLLRFAFHDAAGFVDGHVNITDEKENKGLAIVETILDSIYDNFALPTSGDAISAVIDRADFYAWAYTVAVTAAAEKQEVGSTNDIIPDISVYYGRVSYNGDDENGPTESFPPRGTNTNAAEIEAYFLEKFGFNQAQTVALMGAHTLGGARRITTGHTGMWTQSKNKLNEEYYSNMVDPVTLHNCQNGNCDVLCAAGPPTCDDTCLNTNNGNRCGGWEQVAIQPHSDGPNSEERYQWRHSCDHSHGTTCTHMMLNVDMALFRDLDDHLDADGKVQSFPEGSGCALTDTHIYASCFPERTNTSAIVRSYVTPADVKVGLAAWIDEFADVFDIMIRTVPASVTLTQLHKPTTAPTNAPTASPTIATGTIPNGESCGDHIVDVGCDSYPNPGDGLFLCGECTSGWCYRKEKKGGNIDYNCRPEGFGS